jgi:hypothetical protein
MGILDRGNDQDQLHEHAMRFLYFILACFLASIASVKAQLNQQDPVWMAQQVLPSTINNGLTGYWKLNEGTGTTAFDSSGAGQNGTLKNTATWATFGGIEAASFDGNTAYVNIPTASDLVGTNSVSVSAWLYSTSIGESGKGYYFQTSSTSSAGFPLFFAMTTDAEGVNNTIYTESDGFAPADGMQAPANSVTLNQWINVVILRVSNSNTSIYVNGVLQINGSSGASMSSGATSVQIGNRSSDLARAFAGGICGVRVWNRIITTNEIKAIYGNGPANP